jgi:hypothetical protein
MFLFRNFVSTNNVYHEVQSNHRRKGILAPRFYGQERIKLSDVRFVKVWSTNKSHYNPVIKSRQHNLSKKRKVLGFLWGKGISIWAIYQHYSFQIYHQVSSLYHGAFMQCLFLKNKYSSLASKKEETIVTSRSPVINFISDGCAFQNKPKIVSWVHEINYSGL